MTIPPSTNAKSKAKYSMTNPVFFETENNIAPAGLQAGFIQSADGFSLRYAVSHPATNIAVQGTVILLHGRNEAFEKYFETIEDLNRRGFCVATMDWRGQGGSFRILPDIERGYVRNFTDYSRDLETFIQTIILPDCPPSFYILAHSTGALIALQAHKKLQSHIRRMVLLSPFLGLRRKFMTDKYLRPLANCLALTGFGKVYAHNMPSQLAPKSFAQNPLTHDQTRYMRNAAISRTHPELGISGPTIHWLSQSLSTIHVINNPRFFERFTIPTLILSAGNDRVIDPRKTTQFAQKLHCGMLITVDGAYHELLQESDFYREQVFAAFDAFIPGSKRPKQHTEPVMKNI